MKSHPQADPDGHVPAPPKKRFLVGEILGSLALLAVGLLIVLGPMIFSLGRLLPGDGVDSKLNHYFLEHGFRAFFDRAYPFSFWSPGFFYPHEQALAFSDNLLGSAPIYWLARVIAPPDAAFTFWIAACLALDFLAFAWFARDLGAGRAMALVGAFVFAFGLPRLSHSSHVQLYPQFFTPLALLFLLRFLREPTTRRAMLFCACTVLQLMAGIYLGWFFLLALTLFIPLLLIAVPEARRNCSLWIRTHWIAGSAIVAATGIILFVFMKPYLGVQASEGRFPTDMMLDMIPRPAGWLLPPDRSVWSGLLGWAGLSLNNAQEDRLFAGLGVLIIGALGVFAACRERDADTRRRDAPLRAMVLTAFLLFTFALVIRERFSIWLLIAEYVPGGGAIRAVARINLIILALALPPSLVFFGRWLAARSRRLRYAAMTAIFALTVMEQVQITAHYEAGPRNLQVARLAEAMKNSSVVVFAQSGVRSTCLGEMVDSMWAALMAKKNVVNGYSARWPIGYPWSLDGISLFEAASWFERENKEQPSTFTMIYPAGYGERDIGRSPSLRLHLDKTGFYETAVVPWPLEKICAQEIEILGCPSIVTNGKPFFARLRVRNTSTFEWPNISPEAVQVSFKWLTQGSNIVDSQEFWTPVGKDLFPGEETMVRATVIPPSRPGRYSLAFSVLEPGRGWFINRGAHWSQTPVEVR